MKIAWFKNYEERVKIKGSLQERAEELRIAAKESEQRWLDAREKYYKSLALIPSNKYAANYNKLKEIADNNFFELKLAGEHYVNYTKSMSRDLKRI